MKKKILLLTTLTVLVAVPAFAAVAGELNPDWQCGPLNSAYQQMIGQCVQNGTVSGEEAATVKERMEKNASIREQTVKKRGITGNEMVQSCGMIRRQACN